MKLIVIEDSCCKQVSLPRFVSGKLIPILFYLPADSFFNISSKALPRKVQGPRHSLYTLFQAAALTRQGLTFGGRLYIVNLVITNKAPFAATALRLAFMRL